MTTPRRLLAFFQSSIILSTITVTALSTFSSTAAPRFDVFSSKLLARSWNDQQPQQFPVEEVMRSCGGAVQGLRDGGRYLNRANDGFVFMDDGSYSFGPIAIGGTQNPDSKQVMWRHCFMLSSEERVLCDLRWEHRKTGDGEIFGYARKEASVEALLLSSLGGASRRLERATSIQSNSKEEAESRSVSAIIRCRMASPSQSWNVQRVKWETNCDSPHSKEDDNADDLFASYSLTESTSSLVLACHLKLNTSRRSIARHYSKGSGALQQVEFEHAS